jgi:hypothetical protein
MRNTYDILVKFGRPSCWWEYNFKEVVDEGVDWIRVAKGRV